LFRRQLEFELLISAADPLPSADSMLKIPLPANGVHRHQRPDFACAFAVDRVNFEYRNGVFRCRQGKCDG
jgi:hypothetical protein